MEGLQALVRARHPPPVPPGAGDMFRTPIRRGRTKEETPFPDYRTLLTPEAKTLIEAIYQDDFEVYRDFL